MPSSPPSVVCYSGVGARRSGAHSDAQFARVVERSFKPQCKTSSACPTTLDGWVDWAGASRVTPARCRRQADAGRAIRRAVGATKHAREGFLSCVHGASDRLLTTPAGSSQTTTAHSTDTIAVLGVTECPRQAARLRAAERLYKASVAAAKRSEKAPRSVPKSAPKTPAAAAQKPRPQKRRAV
jgi:hypothetical protein